MSTSPARACGSFAAGHDVNPVAALHRANNPVYASADRRGWVIRIDGDVIVVGYDGGELARFRNHDPARLGDLLLDLGPRVAFSAVHGLLRLEHPGGAFVFNVTPDTGLALESCGVLVDPGR